MDPLIFLMMAHFRADPVAACAGCYSIGARVIHRVAVRAVTDAARAGLTWAGVLGVVVGRMFGSVGCHATSKVAELSCELDYVISF